LIGESDVATRLRLVVTGSQGQVVRALTERGPVMDVDVVALGRPGLDLLQPAKIFGALEAAKPDVVVSAAAYTAVDLAESNAAEAQAVNGVGAGEVARAAARLGAPVVHLSTDYVFNGALDRAYREDDPTGPIGEYGRGKLAGELAVAAANPDHAILRTAWVYSPFGKNFVRTMLNLAATREEISVVADQHGSPTSAHDIADGVIKAARNLKADAAPGMRGVFHMTARGEATWAEFAEAIFAWSRDAGGPFARVRPIPTSAYPTPARRPANSRLDNAKLAREHGVSLPHWREALAVCMARLVPGEFRKAS
jgi:dTDP-4-dehydrorhamnose reductase